MQGGVLGSSGKKLKSVDQALHGDLFPLQTMGGGGEAWSGIWEDKVPDWSEILINRAAVSPKNQKTP